jgi:hypothetical protein
MCSMIEKVHKEGLVSENIRLSAQFDRADVD